MAPRFTAMTRAPRSASLKRGYPTDPPGNPVWDNQNRRQQLQLCVPPQPPHRAPCCRRTPHSRRRPPWAPAAARQRRPTASLGACWESAAARWTSRKQVLGGWRKRRRQTRVSRGGRLQWAAQSSPQVCVFAADCLCARQTSLVPLCGCPYWRHLA